MAVKVVIPEVPPMFRVWPEALTKVPRPLKAAVAVTVPLLVRVMVVATVNKVATVRALELAVLPVMLTLGIEMTPEVPVAVPLMVILVPEKVWAPVEAVKILLSVKPLAKVGVMAALSVQVPSTSTKPVKVLIGLVAEVKVIIPPESTVVVDPTERVKAPSVKVAPD